MDSSFNQELQEEYRINIAINNGKLAMPTDKKLKYVKGLRMMSMSLHTHQAKMRDELEDISLAYSLIKCLSQKEKHIVN